MSIFTIVLLILEEEKIWVNEEEIYCTQKIFHAFEVIVYKKTTHAMLLDRYKCEAFPIFKQDVAQNQTGTTQRSEGLFTRHDCDCHLFLTIKVLHII